MLDACPSGGNLRRDIRNSTAFTTVGVATDVPIYSRAANRTPNCSRRLTSCDWHTRQAITPTAGRRSRSATVGGVAADSDEALTADFGQQRGAIHVQIVAGGRTVWNNDDDSHSWHNWTQMGSQSFWSIASATTGPVSHYYGVGTDGRVYSRDANYVAGTWSNWMPVPGGAAGVQNITATGESNDVHLEILDDSGKMWNNDIRLDTPNGFRRSSAAWAGEPSARARSLSRSTR